MNIREMTYHDAQRVYEIGTGESYFSLEGTEESFWPKSVLEGLVGSKDDVTLVSQGPNDINGYLIATYHPIVKKATIENVWSDGGGQGRLLMQEAERILDEKGCMQYCGLVEAGNTISQNMCMKAGYENAGSFYWMSKLKGGQE
jgi:ribosomal protein S18 acetylase RimI-like enzyme